MSPLRDVPGPAHHRADRRQGPDHDPRRCRRQFGIERPRLAVAGLNPHAGEGGALGREEIDIVIPAIERLREEDADVDRPATPPTRCSTRAMRATYDAALCLYHDQALVPLKTLHFDEGVNMTLGLPIVRTSPDHGTAFAIAGTGPGRAGRDDRRAADGRRLRRARHGRRRDATCRRCAR